MSDNNDNIFDVFNDEKSDAMFGDDFFDMDFSDHDLIEKPQPSANEGDAGEGSSDRILGASTEKAEEGFIDKHEEFYQRHQKQFNPSPSSQVGSENSASFAQSQPQNEEIRQDNFEQTYQNEESLFVPEDVGQFQDENIRHGGFEQTYQNEESLFVPEGVNQFQDENIRHGGFEQTHQNENSTFVPEGVNQFQDENIRHDGFEQTYQNEESPFVPEDVGQFQNENMRQNDFETENNYPRDMDQNNFLPDENYSESPQEPYYNYNQDFGNNYDPNSEIIENFMSQTNHNHDMPTEPVIPPYPVSQRRFKARGSGVLKVAGVLALAFGGFMLVIFIWALLLADSFEKVLLENGLDKIIVSFSKLVLFIAFLDSAFIIVEGIIYLKFSNRLDSPHIPINFALIDLGFKVFSLLFSGGQEKNWIVVLIGFSIPIIALIGGLMNKNQSSNELLHTPTNKIPPFLRQTNPSSINSPHSRQTNYSKPNDSSGNQSQYVNFDAETFNNKSKK